jgi:MFS family permease
VTTDEDRWAQAEELLHGAPGRVAEQRVRRRRLVVWLAIVGGIVAAGAVGLAVALVVHGPHHAERPDPPLWREVTGLCLSAAGLIVLIGALVSLWRAGQFGNAWRAPTTALTREQRRSLRRQVRGKAPLEPAHLALARDLATRLTVSLHGNALLFLGLSLGWVGQLVDRPTAGRAAFYGALLLLWLVGLGLGERERRRAKRFLAAHPAPADEG